MNRATVILVGLLAATFACKKSEPEVPPMITKAPAVLVDAAPVGVVDAVPLDAPIDPVTACEANDGAACLAFAHDPTRDPAEVMATLRRTCAIATAACDALGLAYLEGKLAPKNVAKAALLWERTCKARSGDGCSNLGFLAHNGFGVPKSAPTALARYREGCELGSSLGCENAGRVLGDGDGVAQNIPEATTLLAKGCQLGRAPACEMLSRAAKLLLEDGAPDAAVVQALGALRLLCERDDGDACAEAAWRIENEAALGKDATLALPLYERGCALDDAAGCYHLARLTPDPAKAQPLYERACEQHDARACGEAAKRLIAASLPARAMRFLTEACRLNDKPACLSACELGDPEGCVELANRARRGESFGKDDAAAGAAGGRAIALRTTACEAGDAKACGALASAYRFGSGVAIDAARGVALETTACKLGNLDSCFNLAEQREKGLGVAKDLAGALVTFGELCTRGHHTSCGVLAGHHKDGDGVPTDVKRATELYERACAEACHWCCYNLAEILVAQKLDDAKVVSSLRIACRGSHSEACAKLRARGLDVRKDPRSSRVYRGTR